MILFLMLLRTYTLHATLIHTQSLTAHVSVSVSLSDPCLQELTTTKRLLPVKGTLIVSPTSIVYQWASEIARHAPSLRVFIYDSAKRSEV